MKKWLSWKVGCLIAAIALLAVPLVIKAQPVIAQMYVQTYDTYMKFVYDTNPNSDTAGDTELLRVDGTNSRVALQNGEALSNATNGRIDLAGFGQTNNENLRLDFETNSNQITATTSTGVTNVLLSGIGVTSTSATAGVGYAAGAGCAVTQITSRSTGVTCTGLSGAITTDVTSLAAEASAAFVVTDTSVAIGDTVVLSQRSGSNGGNTDLYTYAVAAGSFTIRVANNNAAGGTAETGAIIINFAVIKAVSS